MVFAEEPEVELPEELVPELVVPVLLLEPGARLADAFAAMFLKFSSDRVAFAAVLDVLVWSKILYSNN